MASPRETITAFIDFVKTPEFYLDIVSTLKRSLLAVLISLSLATIVALIISLHRFFGTISEFPIDFFRSIPATALFPLFLVIFGINDLTRISTATFICFWIILLNILYGIIHIPKIRIETIKLVKASKYEIFKHVLVWEALVHLFSGIRQAITTSLVIIIITEMLVNPQYGLGSRIFYMQQAYKIPQMYALIVMTGILGYGLNKITVTLEKKVIHWTKK